MKQNNSPYIFDIQRFSIHDGPGIRTVLFSKSCPLSCTWCQNPESQKSRAEVAFYSEKCKDCRKCIQVCPSFAIDEITKISNYTTCITCSACIDVCTQDARKMIGQKMSEDEIINELLKDIDFYKDSNGGVTFSGGEPLVYPEFLLKILKRLKAKGIHTNIETCGVFDLEKVIPLLPYIDLIYFDIKHLNKDSHKEYTGLGNEIILENFQELNAVFSHLQIRVPLIPSVNDDEYSIKEISEFSLKNGHQTIHLLPYHSMGNSKAIRIDYKAKIFKVKPHTNEELELIKKQFSKLGIKTISYD